MSLPAQPQLGEPFHDGAVAEIGHYHRGWTQHNPGHMAVQFAFKDADE